MPAQGRRTARIAGLIREVRQLFHLLREVGTGLHADLGVSASLRAVLESLVRHGPATVPELARQRPVSRQHIQRIVDELLARGLVRLEENPAHKRSSRVALTDRGAKLFSSMSAREQVPLARLAARLSPGELETTLKVLAQTRESLAAMLAVQRGTRRRPRNGNA